MSYTALARRYRSTQFDKVVGQEAVARTLAAAIERNRVAHAYLFCGTRGVGKTTMARLFAKALNAPGDQPPEVAQAIMEGRDNDVIEIDAASNRGIDDARELISNCIYRPMRGPYKIYIIDEVHMLTRDAFNALLKTLEEPPEHVKFILCTTESNKVLPTVQSRCQRFDFRAIPTRDIAAHLKWVVEQEGMKSEPAVIQAVARLGAGSMRDALSLLDRLMASGEHTLTLTLLEELLGLPASDLVDGVIAACADGDPKAALNATDALLASGVTMEQTLDALIERLRELMILAACGDETNLVELEGEARDRAAALAVRFDAPALVHTIALCENAAQRIRNSSTPRAVLDAVVVRLALTERIADLGALLASGPPGAYAAPRAGDAEKKAFAAAADPVPATADRGAPPSARQPTPAPTATATNAAHAPLPADASAADVWRRVYQIGGDSGAMRARLNTLRLAELTETKATIAADSVATVAWVKQQEARLIELLRRATGRAVRLDVVVSEQPPAPPPPDSVAAAARADDEALNHPLVRTAIQLFDARVVRIERAAPTRPAATSEPTDPDHHDAPDAHDAHDED